jgi:hypothetical protein
VNGTVMNGGAPGRFARHFAALYKNIVGGEASEYKHWLTPVRD